MDTPPPPEFADLIRSLDHGNTHAEITSELASLTAEVVSRRKPGKLVIEIVVGPADDQARNVTVATTINAKPPKKVPTPSIFFADTAGGLHRDDPYHRPMVTRDLSTGSEVAARDLYDPEEGSE